MKKRFLIAFLCLLISLRADDFVLDLDNPTSVRWMQEKFCPYVLISIPGSGTHLVTKALFLLNQSVPRWHFDQSLNTIFSFSREPGTLSYLCTHFWMLPNTVALHRALGLKKIICIRDLRDVCVTAFCKMREGTWPCIDWNHYLTWKAFLDLSSDEQLLCAVLYERNPESCKDKTRQFSFPLVFQQAIEYMRDSDALVILYENLVGEKGGGSREAQLYELRRLADVLHLNLTEGSLEEIADRLYGDNATNETKLKKADPFITFRKGKIGSWKEVFKEEHKLAFKERFGDVLVQMEYERFNDW